MKVSVKYTSPAMDFSGYGSASRGFIRALHTVGVDVTTEMLSYDNNKTNWFGEDYQVARNLENKDIPYDIKIIHVPCDSYLRHLEPCKYHIGRFVWETDKMSPEWVWNANLMDEIWTGAHHNKRVLENSGVKVPIWIFPETFDIEMANEKLEPWLILGHDGFLFYSVFQWIERKNPQVLIKAYLKEFSEKEKVGLLIKTYGIDGFTDKARQDIVKQIWEWRNELGKADCPRIYVNVELMDKNDVFRIYKSGDCFVLPHRGEGWGRPIMEAMSYGKPIIATNCGGIHDWLTKETYYSLPHREIKVFGMEFAPWYRTDQKWADVDEGELREKMRYVFEHQDEAKETGERGRKFVTSRFSYEAVGRLMKDRLIDIQKMIDGEKKRGIRWLIRH